VFQFIYIYYGETVDEVAILLINRITISYCGKYFLFKAALPSFIWAVSNPFA
jgi:hypothetical protein